MGYNTYITGGFTVTPQISPKDEAAFARFDAGNGADEGYFNVTHKDGDEDVQIVDGEIKVVGKTAGSTEFDFAIDESFKAYEIDSHIQLLRDTAQGLGYVVNGQLDGDGEESDDFWRTLIVNNKIIAEGGTITYPSDRYYEIAKVGRDKYAHGRVIPRPDGKVAKCAGLGGCNACEDEHAWLAKQLYGKP